MKFFIISEGGDGAGLSLRLQDEVAGLEISVRVGRFAFARQNDVPTRGSVAAHASGLL